MPTLLHDRFHVRSLLRALSSLGVCLLVACGGGTDDAPSADPGSAPVRTASTLALDAADATAVAQGLIDLDIAAQRDLAAATEGRKQVQALQGEATIPTLLPRALDAFCRANWERCGDRTDEWVLSNGQIRRYVLWRPLTARLRASVPLVVMLHGTNQDGPQFFNISGWREKALREGLVVAFPSALQHCYRQDDDHDGTLEAVHVLAKWADGQIGSSERPLCPPALMDALGVPADVTRTLADDVDFFRRLVAKVKRQNAAIDLKRVYVTGFSNGAAMAGRLAAEASDEIAAVHSGSSVVAWQVVDATAGKTIRPISVLHTIGSEDEEQKARFGFEKTPIPLTESLIADRATNPAYYNAVVLPFASILRIVPDTYTYDAPPITGYANGPSVSVASSRFTFRHSPRFAGNGLRTMVIDGATHEYPNGRNHPVILAEHVWTFFSGYRLP